MAKKIIFGLTGEFASGKGTITEYLVNKHSFKNHRFSSFLRETLGMYDLVISRGSIQILSTVMRANFGEDVLARAMAKRTKSTDDERIVIDGVRRFTDIDNLKEIEGFVLVGVKAGPEVRYERYVKRNENAGDREMDYKTFLDKHKAEADREIPFVLSRAEYSLDNNGSMEELYKQVDELVSKRL